MGLDLGLTLAVGASWTFIGPCENGIPRNLAVHHEFPPENLFFCVIPLLFLLDPYCWKKCEMVGGLIENRQACWIGPWLLGSTHTGMCWLFESHIWLPNLHA